MGAIQDIYGDLDADVPEEEFREAVEAKVEQMGGLADEETAAMLVAHELTDRQVTGVADVEPGMEEVKFVAKVTAIGAVREFERDGDEEPGHVVNVELADETGSVRAAFWDEMARSAVDELAVGQVLRVKGRPRDGYDGVEVSVDHAEPDEDTEIDVSITEGNTIDSLSMGRSDVTVRGRVLDVDDTVRTFDRDDGSEGKVANLVLGDETGRIRVTLWDERTDLLDSFDDGDSVEVIDGYVREREGDLELHVGSRGAIDTLDESVEYVPDTTDIATLEIDQTVDIAGVVRSADPKRTFDRDDGSEGQVRNVRVQDRTGDIRIALWGEKADVDLTPGDEIQLTDVEIQDGWQDDLEASAGWQSTVTVLDGGTGGDVHDPSDGDEQPVADEPGLDAFADTADAPRTSEASANGQSADDDDEDGYVEFTGVVVQAGDPVVLDDGEETVSVDTDASVELGEEVIVRGERRGGRVDADDVLTT